MCGHRLLLDATDRQHEAAQADLTRHGDVVAHRPVGHQRHERRIERDACARPVLRDRARRDVHVDVALFEPRRIDAERLGLRLEQAQCRLRAFLHHVAELAGEDQLAAARDAGGFDEQDVAAHRRPRKARGHARHADAHRDFVLELRRTEDVPHVVRIDADRRRLALGHAHRDVTQHRADFALETATTRLTRVLARDRVQCLVGDRTPGPA